MTEEEKQGCDCKGECCKKAQQDKKKKGECEDCEKEKENKDDD